MKIDPHLLKFPKYLPNDLEGFMFYYPEKFPLIVSYYEEVCPKIAVDPKAFQEYGNWARDELFAGFEKVKNEYDRGDHDNLEFLIDIDQRFHKVFCFRFWIVNYLLPDGPLHDFFVDNLKNSIRKFIDITEDIEDFEEKVVRVQRDLLQSDYADLYLRQALSGVGLVELLEQNPKTKELVSQATTLIDLHSHDNTAKINDIWNQVAAIIQDENDPGVAELREKLIIPLDQAKMRSSMLPVYNMLTHAIEFRNENQDLEKRHSEMKGKIDAYLDEARAKLTPEEYDLFELSYLQARNFSMYKDIMGEIDPVLLPLWFKLHDEIKKIISKTTEMKPRQTGPTAVIHHLVWHLPDEMKAKVMTPDSTPFSLETL